MRTLDGGRIGIAAQALGIARAAFEDAARYAQRAQDLRQADRRAPGDPVQARRHATEIDAARLLLWRAAVKKDQRRRYATEAAMAKLFASEVANRAAKEAVQIFGGYGYLDATSRSSGTSATRRSPRSTRAPARSSGW